MQTLPGFRELYPEDAARRAVIVETWRNVARVHGFDEYDGPTLEPLDLYAKKNAGGEEILGQIYRFEDAGGRHVALRPELTPTFARMIAARESHYRKPIKWFSTGSFFRYERQQRGRLREFLQFNCDIVGDTSPAADAELIALAIDTMRAFGLAAEDIVVRLGHRGAWRRFFEEHGVEIAASGRVLQVVDKIEREPANVLEQKLTGTGVSLADVQAFIASGTPPDLQPVIDDLTARSLGGFVNVDLSIVRGLAYYTGTVFEIFDRSRTLRAVAGGGRYDGLIADLSNGRADLPAVGFGMGDVVLCHLLDGTPTAKALLDERVAACRACDVYVVIADEAQRSAALGLVQTLRDKGLRTEFPLAATKVGKQFQAAEMAGAQKAVVIGSEWPRIKIKTLATREEIEVSNEELALMFHTKKAYSIFD